MESLVKTNGPAKKVAFNKPLLNPDNELHAGSGITVQQALYKWYSLFNQGMNNKNPGEWIFPELAQEELLNSFQTDIELIPSVLMNQFISTSVIQDKKQYIRLLQALLINLSDCLFIKQGDFRKVCNPIENTLQFLQNFFSQYFDLDSRMTKFCFHQFCGCFKLKLEYWQIKLNHSSLLDALNESLEDKFTSPENNITYRKIGYIKYLLQKIESAATVVSEKYVREVFIYNNFNSLCFINYEIGLIKVGLVKFQFNEHAISFLQSEQERVDKLKIKSGISFDPRQPSLKKQLADWLNEEIKQIELKNRKANDKCLQLDPDSKIQTSLSVAKLAVLIRLLVVDKIIINKSVAPMLRTLAKMFTTLQKDEISFGSLETKYHAPDKATLNNMKELLGKWINILGKL
ncbi:MAG: hypothetical protein KF825_06685 [Ferruginibacter sp.]|nr:hypothetical protein [Ferruginibacter sp.]